MSKGKALLLGFLAASLAASAGFSGELLLEDWAPVTAKNHPLPTKLLLLLGSVALQGAVVFDGRPRRRACVRLLWEHRARLFKSDPKVRVSLMVVRNYSWYRRLRARYWGARQSLPRQYLAVAYRTPDEEPRTLVQFHKGEGVAGVAWSTRRSCAKQDLPDPTSDREGWMTRTSELLAIAPEKAARFNRMCRSYACSPVFDGIEEASIRGVISVDSLEEGAFSAQVCKEVERFARYLGFLPF